MNCVYSATGDYVCTPPTAISEKFQNADNCGPQNGPRTKDCCDNACYQKIWKDAVCTTPKQHDDWSVTQTKESLTQDSNAWGVLTSENHRKGCYGTDRTKWPGYVAPKPQQDQVMQKQQMQQQKTERKTQKQLLKQNQQIEAPPMQQQDNNQMQQQDNNQMQQQDNNQMQQQDNNQMQQQDNNQYPNESFDQHGYQNESFDQYQPYTQNSSY
jgi:hypothetical protein